MTSAYAITQVKRLIDKYDDTSTFSTDEILGFLNMAQLEVLNRMVPDSLGGNVNFDFDRNTLTNIEQLIYQFSMAISETSGDSVRILLSDILTKVRTLSGEPAATINRLCNLSVITSTSPYQEEPIRYKTLNRFASSTINTFLKPTTSNRFYILEGDSVKCFPAITGNVRIKLIKDPLPMTAGNSPEWSDYVMNQIIFKAVELAGVSTHDSQAIQDIRNSGIQSAE